MCNIKSVNMEQNDSPRVRVAGSIKAVQISTPNSLKCKTSKYFHLFPVINTNTPPRLLKVKNPFEVFERLHLPACSPLLLKRPTITPITTPQRTHDHFEWTIDEISTMQPAHLEPHATQFQTPHDYDSETEARAQAAIRTFFNKKEIVPSPMDCQLRHQKIHLEDEVMETSRISMSVGGPKTSCDGAAQTVLTFPPILPNDIENLLKPYFSYTVDQQQSSNDCDTATKDFHDARDASLRRKLFQTSDASSETSSIGPTNNSLDDIDFDSMSPAPQTPDLNNVERSKLTVGLSLEDHMQGKTLTIALDELSPVLKERESFGALSPIVKFEESPASVVVTPPSKLTTEQGSGDSSIVRSTPEKKSSPIDFSMSIDGVTRHASSEKTSSSMHHLFGQPDEEKDLTNEWELSSYDDSITNYLTQEESIVNGQDEIIINNNISTDFYRHTEDTNHKNTPQRPRTSTNRKNLSRSFNMLTNCSDEDDDDNTDEMSMVVTQRAKKAKSLSSPSARTFYRMDSGFNDEDYSASQISTSVDDSSRFQVLAARNFNISEDKENLKHLANTSSVMPMFVGSQGQEDCDVSMQSHSDDVNFMCSTPSRFV